MADTQLDTLKRKRSEPLPTTTIADLQFTPQNNLLAVVRYDVVVDIDDRLSWDGQQLCIFEGRRGLSVWPYVYGLRMLCV